MRRKLIRKSAKKAGAPPGTLVHVGEKPVGKARMKIIAYDGARIEETRPETAEECLADSRLAVRWIDVEGIHDIGLLEAIGSGFGIHPLVLEDILNTEHRPKVEEFDEYLFIVLKMFQYDEASHEIVHEQVSLILGPSFVLSFQEKEGDVFDGVRDRARVGKGRIRRMGADYLAYALLDSVVDSYFAILEKIGDRLDLLEEELITFPSADTLHRIHRFKREMILLRKAVWPLREVIAGMQRSESSLILESTEIFLRDVYDHSIQIVDTVETFRDIISGMLDLYLSSLSNRMNEVMKVLTIMATIFIPLTFIAGIYGMNFENMPELRWRWGYPAAWLVMLGAGGGMLLFFKKKKWL